MKRSGKTTCFEYFYIFVFVVYMSQLTISTRYNTFSFTNPLPSLIPLALTIALIYKTSIHFNSRRLKTIIFAFLIWFCSYVIKYTSSGGTILPLWVSYLSIIIIYSYIHVYVFRGRLFTMYRNVLVLLSFISLIFWSFQIFLPGLAHNIYTKFPDTGEYGYNVLYLYKYMVGIEQEEYHGFIRNSGCSWEPGRFSVMIVLALYADIIKHGRIVLSKGFIILNLALLSTMSTTGIPIAFILYLMTYLRKFTLSKAFVAVCLFLPVAYFILQQDFVSIKLTAQTSTFNDIDSYAGYMAARNGTEAALSIERLPSLRFELQNLINDPIIGYGYWTNSYFYNNVTHYATLCGGSIRVLAMYGIFLGLYFYYCLYKSSIYISQKYSGISKLSLFVIMLLSSISYPVFGVMLFTTFWMYGYFAEELDNK